MYKKVNRNYTEVYAHIPDHTGLTPDILFRTLSDVNYKPNLVFPILPSQYSARNIRKLNYFHLLLLVIHKIIQVLILAQFDTPDFTMKHQLVTH